MPLPVSTRRAGVMGSAPGPAMALTEDDLPTQPKYHGKVCCCLTASWRAAYSRGLPSSVEELARYGYQAQLPAQAVPRLVIKLVVQEPKGLCSWCKLTRVFPARLYSQHLSCLAVWTCLLLHWAWLSSWPQALRKQGKECVTAYC